MKCEVSQTNDVNKIGNLRVSRFYKNMKQYTLHRFWYTKKMLNKMCSGLVTLLFFINCIKGY